MKVDRLDIDLGVEGVLDEENRAARIVGHVESFLKKVVINKVRRFSQGNNVPFPRNLFFKCVFPPTSGPKVPVVDAEASSAQEIEKKNCVDAICLRRGRLSSVRSVTEICHNFVNINHMFGQYLVTALLAPHSKLIRLHIHFRIRSHISMFENICLYKNMLSCIINDKTTFEMELCGRKRATAQAHAQSHCMWLNFEHTKKFESFKKNPRRRKSNSNLLINSKKHRNRSNLIRAAQ